MWNYPYREPVNGFTHLFAAIMAVIGTVWLASMTWGDTPRAVAVLVFGFSLIVIYVASSVMHLFNGAPEHLDRLVRFDHAAIYIGIAGGYTPFIYHLLDGEWRLLMLTLIWGIALLGVTSKLLFFWGGHLSTLLYVAMGWVGVIAAPQVLASINGGILWLILAGGLVYTAGAVIFAIRRPNFHRHFGHHEVWHLCVMGGSAFHFAAVAIHVI